MKRWTLGFVFTSDFSQVLLIHKEHPESQKGKWNGLGGKYEDGETSSICIAREIEEESGLTIDPRNWRQVGKVHGTEWEMDILTAIYPGDTKDAKTRTDETVQWFPFDSFPLDMKYNLHWLIPLCVDALKRDEIEQIDIMYTPKERWR